MIGTTAQDTENRYMDLVKTQHSMDMLSIKDFVKVVNYNIDPLFIDEQWTMLNVRSPDEFIALTPQMIKRLHFSKIANLIKKLEQMFPESSLSMSMGLEAPSRASKQCDLSMGYKVRSRT